MLRIGNGGTTGSLVGDVVNNGVLAFDRFNHLSYTGAVSGIGALAKHGAGTLTLTGNNTYTGNTTVDRGALMVNGSIATSNLLTVNAGGLVGGTGTLPSTIVNGGTLSPGHSIGTINVQGNLTFSNTTNYLVDVSRTAADQINVSGTATLGGTVWLVATPDDYGRNTTYTILHAGSGVSGTETLSASVSSVFLDPTLSYDANNVFLNLTQLPFSSAAQTPNQRVVADALQAGGIHSALGAAVFGQTTTASARHAFNALSGEVHASVAGVLLDDSRYLRGAVLGRLRQAPYAEGPLAAFGVGGPMLAYEQPQPPVHAANFPFKGGARSVAPLRTDLLVAGLRCLGHLRRQSQCRHHRSQSRRHFRRARQQPRRRLAHRLCSWLFAVECQDWCACEQRHNRQRQCGALWRRPLRRLEPARRKRLCVPSDRHQPVNRFPRLG